jgi:AAA family ATP:ADP antiporter
MADALDSRPTLIERGLRLVTDVRAGEAPLVLALTLNVFLLLTAYYIIKPVREALILTLEGGAEYKAYSSGAIAIVLLGAVPIYGWFVDRLPRLKLVVGVTLFFASHLVLFFLASQIDAVRPTLGILFYIWIGLFNLMVVAQLWSFANDLYDVEQGKRLFPVVALGASIGAAAGSQIASWLVEPLGVYILLLVSAAILAVCSYLFVVAERQSSILKARRRAEAEAAQRAAAAAGEAAGSVPVPAAAASSAPAARSLAAPAASKDGGFALVFRYRYLLAIAFFTLVYNWVNSNGEYMLGKVVREAARAAVESGSIEASEMGSFIGRTYADFFFAVNVLGVALQAFVVSRVVKYGGLGLALLVLPVISLCSSLAVFVWPVLMVIRIGKTLENGTDYSLNSTVRQMLWLPTSPAMKYKAKQAVDTLFVRLGDVSSALLVLVGAGSFGWTVRGFAIANGLLVSIWLALVALILREAKKLEGGMLLEESPAATRDVGLTTQGATSET